MRIITFLINIALGLGILLSSCSRDDHAESPESSLRLELTLPSGTMPPYSRSSALVLRATVEIDDVHGLAVHRRVFAPVLDSDSSFVYTAELPPGKYRVKIWTDRTTPSLAHHCYDNTLMNSVLLRTGDYIADPEARDAAYFSAEVELQRSGTTVRVPLVRPMARYRIVTTDAERYRELSRLFPSDYPPLEELTARIAYEQFLPSSFNVVTGRPNDSATGVSYSFTPVAGTDGLMTVASDFVLTNGSESFVRLTIAFIDSTGRTVRSVSGVRVNYRRGYTTTVSGSLLTGSAAGGGITIDTSWGEDIIIDF